MNIEAELLILQTNLDDLHRKVQAEIERFRNGMFEMEDRILELMDKRAVLQAASQGIEIGTVVIAKRPLLWQGKLTDGLCIKVARVSAGFEPHMWHASGFVAVKGGWSKREISFDPSWVEIAS
jgi:hypothetical protein